MICKLRSWHMKDAPALASLLSNPNILRNLRDGIPFPYTQADAADYISSVLSADSHKNFSFAITVDDELVGSIGAFRQENIHYRTAELGYYIAEPHWGEGIGTAAVTQLCDTLFSNTDILRIFAEPFAHNAASCRVLEKAGFSFEGTLRKNAVKNNTVIDMKMYARIKE